MFQIKNTSIVVLYLRDEIKENIKQINIPLITCPRFPPQRHPPAPPQLHQCFSADRHCCKQRNIIILVSPIVSGLELPY